MSHRLLIGRSSVLLSIGKILKNITRVLFLSFLIGGCYQPIASSLPQLTPLQIQPTPTVITATPTQPEPSPSPTQPAYTVWLPGYLPKELRTSISLPAGFSMAVTPDSADISLEVGNPASSNTSLWIYTLVAPFPTLTDGISADELHSFWISGLIAQFNNSPLLMDESTLEVLIKWWGKPANQAVLVLSTNELLDYAWTNQPSWAIIPFEGLDPRWKVLNIDRQSPIHKDFDPTAYALSIPFTLTGSTGALQERISLPASNRDTSKLTTVAMTGVTAMVRATAYTMELRGITYPAEDIGPMLSSADITHISNEIPFSPDCPYPTSTMKNLVFCSNPSYIDLLKAVGTDIIELTGDHFMDYKTEATLYTLQMYKDLGWPYYGGGANPDEARQPVKLENNGNRIAFMGCNVGCQVKTSIPCDAIATDRHPGAAQCDDDYINSEIPLLRDEGYQVIFSFQHNEYYTYTTEPILVNDFGLVAAAGAAIVSGSQAHQAHGFAFQDGAFIHYGLGNLFFDQYHYCAYYACDDAFIDRHVFYDGKYINTELITIHFVDYARPRLMTPEERDHFLNIIFNASRW